MDNLFTESSKHFDVYLAAWRKLEVETSAYYDLRGHFIYLDNDEIDGNGLFEYTHEFVHSQLGNTIPGLILLTLFEASSMVEKELFGVITRNVLEPLKTAFPELYRELFLFGVPQKATSQLQSDLFWSSDKDNSGKIREAILSNKRTAISLRAFHTITRRTLLLANAWRNIHEGLAVYSTIRIGTGDRAHSLEHLKESAQRLAHHGIHIDASTLVDEYRRIASHQNKIWERGVLCDKNHLKAYRLCKSIENECGSLQAVWVAVLAASHIDYSVLPLLDMTEADFAEELINGAFSFDRRLEQAAKKKKTLRNLSNKIIQGGELNTEEMKPLLSSLDGQITVTKMKESCFNRWFEESIWQSKVFADWVKEMKIDWEANSTALKTVGGDDRTSDFLMGSPWNAPVIWKDGKVTGVNENEKSNVKRRLINCHEVERTWRLITWLGLIQ